MTFDQKADPTDGGLSQAPLARAARTSSLALVRSHSSARTRSRDPSGALIREPLKASNMEDGQRTVAWKEGKTLQAEESDFPRTASCGKDVSARWMNALK